MQHKIAQYVTLACLLEATAPKPGNVHRGADFDDLTFADFLVSGVTIGPILAQGTETVVFVEEAPGRFRQRPVQLGRAMQDAIVVQRGVHQGERVVTHGVLLLHALFQP